MEEQSEVKPHPAYEIWQRLQSGNVDLNDPTIPADWAVLIDEYIENRKEHKKHEEETI